MPCLKRSRLPPPRPLCPRPSPCPSPSPGFFFGQPTNTTRAKTAHSAIDRSRTLFICKTPPNLERFARSQLSLEPRRPRRAAIISPRLRQLNLVVAARISQEQRGFPDARRAEDEVTSVGREGRIFVVASRSHLVNLIRLQVEREHVEPLLATDVSEELALRRPAR